ncbi:MAG: carboxypeptidase-like regulatory domain-containing protein [Saprospirales bacterium]|nr:MAG: carboxypeptidase-like regulatory domain-containing protein [Saprospirales bacterium]
MKEKGIFLWFPLLLVLAPVSSLSAQKTSVEGYIFDYQTDEPLIYAHVIFEGSTQGTVTDTTGYFLLESEEMRDKIKISTVGYHAKTVSVEPGQKNQVELRMKDVSVGLDEVVVKPDDGPVMRLMQKVRDNLDRNNPENLDSYSYRRYSRWAYQINNVSDNMRDWGIFRNAKNAFRYDQDSMRYLPVYFSEQVVTNSYQSRPRKQLSLVEADNTTGLGLLEDSEISGITAGLRSGLNIYDRDIRYLGHNFISPLGPNGPFYYNYYLMDSIETSVGYDQVVLFSPKREGDNTLRGELVIEDRFYSIREFTAELTNTAHLNFVKSLSVSANYQFIHDSIPFFESSKISVVIDYMPIESRREHRVELQAVMTQNFSRVSTQLDEEIKLSHRRLTYEAVRSPDRHDRDQDFWKKERPAQLDKDEELFMASIDSVNQLWFIRFLDKVARMSITGYYDLDYWELGPYDYLLNFNEVQGTHLFFGGRTGQKISERYAIWGGVGYGTRNKQWLGRFGAGYLFPSARRMLVEAEYTDDIAQSGENERILFLYENKQHASESNILSHIFRRQSLKELQRRQRLRVSMEREVRTGFQIQGVASATRLHSPEFLPYLKNDQPIDNFEGAELTLNMRWSWEEQYFDYGYRRLYLGTELPIINLSLSGGITNVGGSSNTYSRVHSSIKHHTFTGQARLDYAIEGGVIFGTVPYPLLDIPRANLTYGFQTYNFNMIDLLEFMHDRYVRVYAEYRLNGFLFKRVPLLDRLGLREVLSVKAFAGSLHERHESLLDYPLLLTDKNTRPYGELGFGVENLFRFFRVDCLWRATHPGGYPLGIRVRMEIRI